MLTNAIIPFNMLAKKDLIEEEDDDDKDDDVNEEIYSSTTAEQLSVPRKKELL